MLRRVGAGRARRVLLREGCYFVRFVFLSLFTLYLRKMNLGLSIPSFSSPCCLGASASARADFSLLHAPFVSKMAVARRTIHLPPQPFLHVDGRCKLPGLARFQPVHVFPDVSELSRPGYLCPSRRTEP